MILILVGMVIILLGIGQLFNHDIAGKQSETDSLRKEVYDAEDGKVIGSNSVFHNFLSHSLRRHGRRQSN